MPIQKFQHLICPIDGEVLTLSDKQLSCATGHCFDIAKQGYVNLLPVQNKKSLSPGDSKAMVEARNRFLNSDLYQPVLEQLRNSIEALELPNNARILDAGCGEGYYTKKLTEHFPDYQFIGLDISKEALKFASKKSDTIDWLVASNSLPPIKEESIDLIICIFGFHSFSGFSKVLSPQGKVILVDPDTEHLIELRELIYPQVKKRPAYSIADAAQYNLKTVEEKGLNFLTPQLKQSQIQDLLLMTPHLFRASAEGKRQAEDLQSIRLTVDMLFRTLAYQ